MIRPEPSPPSTTATSWFAPSKRISVIVRSSAWDDLAICNFYLPASQSLSVYTMRMHATVAWTDATIAFYAADVNGTSSTGAFQLDDVAVMYRPVNSSAKTDCVDPNAPTSGGSTGSNLISNGDFSNGTTDWTLSGSMTSAVVSGVLTYYRTTGSTTPLVGQVLGSAAAGQRVAAVFEMGNSSATRQRVTVSVQESDATTFQSCVFWLAAGAPRRTFAMTTSAPVSWSNGTWSSAGGSKLVRPLKVLRAVINRNGGNT